MPWALSDISGYAVQARDGSLGIVRDMYFDDVEWRVRYLAVSGGSKSGAGRYLLAPEVISRTDREFGSISVFLRIAAVHDSPIIAATRNLPRQDERRLREYYGWPDYWPALPEAEQDAQELATGNPHLHSLEEVLGYRLLAGGDDLGPLIDLIVDEHTWKIHCLEVDASSWLPAGRAWLRADCIQHVRGARKQIALNLCRDAALVSPQPDLRTLNARATQGAVPGPCDPLHPGAPDT